MQLQLSIKCGRDMQLIIQMEEVQTWQAKEGK